MMMGNGVEVRCWDRVGGRVRVNFLFLKVCVVWSGVSVG